MRPWFAVFILLIVTSISVTANAAEWVVETGDFRPHTGSLQKLNTDILEVVKADGAVESLPMRDVLRMRLEKPVKPRAAAETSADVDVAVNQTLKINGVLMTVASTSTNVTQLTTPDGQQKPWLTSVVRQIMQANAARNHRGTLTLELNGGDCFAGKPTGIDAATLIWNNDLLGELRLPVERLQRLVRLPEKSSSRLLRSTEDAVLLGNGDIVRGIVSNLSSGTLSLQAAGGSTTDIPLDSLQEVSFAQTAPPSSAAAQGFALQLSDGSRLEVQALKLEADQWSVTRFDGAANHFPFAALQAVEHVGGPVQWLSDLRPIEAVSRTYFGREWPAQFNRAVDGGALLFGSREYLHGIGVHSYSKLTFDVPSGFDRLHLNYGIDGEAPYADVHVRVLLDDKVAIDSPHVRAGILATPPTMAMAGAARISLEVDYGDNQDVQDRFDWIEPALLRSDVK